MVYIIMNDSHETDDYWHGGSSIEYVSLDKEKAVSFFEKLRYWYMTLPGNEIEDDAPEYFTVFVGKWCYTFELISAPEDTDLSVIPSISKSIF